ncbi:hypothetical protein BDN71DRAFT_1436768 [Pleurotus eryngii]|uniref:Uncharacterized protein n=1 Tax=Pleurotus eryngii TaxID=5323 RepID=A0A9P5ZJM3_PLEER|nr:hypothetical protein BDN71DRAFT_1436768 [Pleurotus eryngii]
MQTTLADLLEMLSQLDLSTVVNVPPGIFVLIAGLNAMTSALAAAATMTGAADFPMPTTVFSAVFSSPPPGTPAQTTPRVAAPSMPSAESTMSSSCGCGSFIPPPGSPSADLTYRYGIVEPLINGVPGWKCKSFSTLAVVTTHFNACAAAGITGVHID